jgi:hypothetical protein
VSLKGCRYIYASGGQAGEYAPLTRWHIHSIEKRIMGRFQLTPWSPATSTVKMRSVQPSIVPALRGDAMLMVFQ